MLKFRQVAAVVIVVALGVTASACGRMAPLDSPYQAAVDKRNQAIEDEADVIPPEPKPPVTDKKFFLDPLI